MPIKSKKLFYAEKILRVLGPEWKEFVGPVGKDAVLVKHHNRFFLERKDGFVTDSFI